MADNRQIIPNKKKCSIYQRTLVGKYISQHYRRKHKDSEYFTQVTRGINYHASLKNKKLFIYLHLIIAQFAERL